MQKHAFLAFFFFYYIQISFSQIPKDSLYAFYYLDGTAWDTSGNGHNGTINNRVIPIPGVLTEDRSGQHCATYFGNATLLVNLIPEVSSLNQSLSFWYRVNGGFAFNSSTYIGITKDTIFIREPTGRLVWKGKSDNTVWNHLVLAQSQEQVAVYINGTLAGTYALPFKDSHLFIRSFNVESGSGAMDDIALYTKTLNASEVNQLFKAPSSCQQITTDLISKEDLSGLCVFPNPSQGSFSVSLANETSHLILRNLEGKAIQEIAAEGKTATFEQVPAGSYVLELSSISGARFSKVVVH